MTTSQHHNTWILDAFFDNLPTSSSIRTFSKREAWWIMRAERRCIQIWRLWYDYITITSQGLDSSSTIVFIGWYSSHHFCLEESLQWCRVRERRADLGRKMLSRETAVVWLFISWESQTNTTFGNVNPLVVQLSHFEHGNPFLDVGASTGRRRWCLIFFFRVLVDEGLVARLVLVSADESHFSESFDLAFTWCDEICGAILWLKWTVSILKLWKSGDMKRSETAGCPFLYGTQKYLKRYSKSTDDHHGTRSILVVMKVKREFVVMNESETLRSKNSTKTR